MVEAIAADAADAAVIVCGKAGLVLDELRAVAGIDCVDVNRLDDDPFLSCLGLAWAM